MEPVNDKSGRVKKKLVLYNTNINGILQGNEKL